MPICARVAEHRESIHEVMRESARNENRQNDIGPPDGEPFNCLVAGDPVEDCGTRWTNFVYTEIVCC